MKEIHTIRDLFLEDGACSYMYQLICLQHYVFNPYLGFPVHSLSLGLATLQPQNNQNGHHNQRNEQEEDHTHNTTCNYQQSLICGRGFDGGCGGGGHGRGGVRGVGA